TEGEAAARARFMIGEIQFEKKNHQAALKNFFEVAYGYAFPQWQAAAQYEAGRCFEVLGKPDQARQSYQEVVDKYPGSSQAGLARERLKALGGKNQPEN
ncbi:MAG TPA: tetratricopeptide repeat protein, partial [Pirellulales bacterium]